MAVAEFNEPEFPNGYIPSGGVQNVSWFRRNIKPEPSDVPLNHTSLLGTPLYASLVFKNISGEQLESIEDKNVKELVGQNPASPEQGFELTQILMSINQTRNIVRTTIQGRSGTVKEYVSAGDYAIKIQGAIVSEHPLVSPKEAMKKLVAFFDLKFSLEVASSFLAMFGVTKLVVDTYTVEEVVGSRNMIAFSAQAWSDTDFKIEKTNVGT